MIIIYNSKLGIIYGAQQFKNFFGFDAITLFQSFDLTIIRSNFNEKINVNKRFFNLTFEAIHTDDNITEWLINVKEICCDISSIEFTVDHNLYITNFYFNKNLNEICDKNCSKSCDFNGKHIKDFDNEVFQIITEHIKTNICLFNNLSANLDLLLVNTTFSSLYDKEYLVYILFDKSNNTYKIICKSICEFLKEKIKTKVQNNIVTNKNFFYHIFHEIRNYLNIISISSDNLLTSIHTKLDEIDEIYKIFKMDELLKLKNNDIVSSDKKDIIESINHIKDSTRTIVDIISDVLTLEKLRTNEITIRPAYFMLIDLCQSCMLSMNQNAINKDINFVCENNVGSISIKGDYIRLKQVIINLISNSFKFTSNGGKVIFSINKEENNHKIFIKFSIKDNGIGIKDENYNLIFKDFQQIEPDKLQNGKGTGLGLSIAKMIVEKHDGIIGFNSKYNQGSEFYFMIPFIQIEELSTQLSNDTYSLESTSPNYKKNNTNKQVKQKNVIKQKSNKTFSTKLKTIINENKETKAIDFTKIKLLFIDDNKTIQKLFLKVLNNLSITNIFIASNGFEAYNIYLEEYNKNKIKPFDIILMDQEMPIMDGNECCKKIMKLNKSSIIIGVTGNALIEQKEKFINSGATEICEKPINKEVIIYLINKYCI